MPAKKVVEEAIRSLNRIQERTQLPYAWFAASFLEKLLKNMFSCIRINKDDLAKVKTFNLWLFLGSFAYTFIDSKSCRRN